MKPFPIVTAARALGTAVLILFSAGAYCQEQGYDQLFQAVGATFIEPSCGACINAGPGVSRKPTDVTISAINRNFPGRSGPGQLYLASPYTVAASGRQRQIGPGGHGREDARPAACPGAERRIEGLARLP